MLRQIARFLQVASLVFIVGDSFNLIYIERHKGVIGLPIKSLCISIIKIYNACIIIHSVKCEVVIPGEEQLSSIPIGNFLHSKEEQ